MNQPKVIAGRYEILREIGQGGMGTVYCGRDQVTGETVAVKALKAEIVRSDPHIVERFDREGEALRRLNHPNIVKVLAMIQENDQHYLIMEYVGGGTLDDLLTEQPLPLDQFLNIALDLADALTRAHRLKILHRDIKPANVLLADDGTPRLTDFGVARFGDRTRVTEAGAIVGTYSYLSPESLYSDELDERSDIWSLGVMFYEMLAGRRPFEGAQVAAVVNAILNNPVADLRELRPDVPPVLADLINRMLEKDRERRLSSTRLVGAELEAIIRGADSLDIPVDSNLRQQVVEGPRFNTPTPEASVFPTTPSRHPQVVKDPNTGDEYLIIPKHRSNAMRLLAIMPLLILIGIIVFALIRGRQQAAKSALPTVEPVAAGEYLVLVAQPEQLGGTERDVARFVADELRQTLELQVPFSKLRIRSYPRVIVSDEEAQAAAQAVGATVIIWGNYDDRLVTLNVQMGVPAAFPLSQFPEDMLERAANVRITLTHEREQSAAPQVLGVLAVLQAADGDGYEFMRTIAILDAIEVSAADILGTGVAADIHRYFALYLQDTAAAVEAVQSALTTDPSNALAYGLLGVALKRQQQYEEAERAAQTATRLGPENWTLPLYLEANGEHETPQEVIDLLTRIVDLRPQDWFPLSFRGSMYYEVGDYTQARADLERAIELGPNANFPFVFLTLIDIRQARIAEAETLIQRIVREYPDPTLVGRVISATFGASSPENFLGVILSSFGNLVIGQYPQVIADVESAGPMALVLPELSFMRGVAQCELDDYEAAAAAFEQGIALDPDFGILYMLHASALQKQGKTTEAAAEFDEVVKLAADISPELPAFVEQFRSGEQGCDTVF